MEPNNCKRSGTQTGDFLLIFDYGQSGEVDGDNLRYVPGRGITNGIVDSYPLRTDYIATVKKLGLCNGFYFWVNDDDLERVWAQLKDGYSVLTELWHDFGKFAAGRGVPPRQHADAMTDQCRRMVREFGAKAWVSVFAECDNHPWCLTPAVATRAEAFRNLTEFLSTSNEWIPTFPPKDDSAAPRGLSPFNYLRERGITPEELNLTTLCCQTFSPHLLYKLGSQMVAPEGNVGNSHQITVAFVRGAARQYGKPWFYEAAPFDCQADQIPMAYDSRRRRIAGFSESYMLRSWLTGFLSGCKVYLFQASEKGFFIRMPDDKLELSPQGEIGRDFADFCLRRHPNRGKPCVPIALLLAEDHGYTPAYQNQPRVFLEKVPDDRANRSIEAFFRLAFPGCHATNGYSFDINRWAPGGSYERQQPWVKPGFKNVQEFGRSFHEALRDGVVDQRPLERAFLTAATWGDSFDVLVDNAPLDVLKKYEAVILLGSIRLTNDLRERLQAYVKAGGRVLMNVAQTSAADEKFLGVSLTGKILRQPFHAHSLITGRIFNEGRYDYAQVVPAKDTDILIEAGHFGSAGNPVLTRHKLGQGEVWLATTPDYLATPEKHDLTWMESCKEAADEFIRPHLAVEVQGPPLEWLVNDAEVRDQRSEVGGQRSEDCNRKSEIENRKSLLGPLWVTLVNNSAEVWSGRVLVKQSLGRVTCRDIWNEKAVPFEYDDQGRVLLKPEIAPWDFKVIEITGQ